jgi:hypothetical protein
MLGIAVYIAVFAYGRVKKEFSYSTCIILLVVAIVDVLWSFLFARTFLEWTAAIETLILAVLFEILVLVALFALGMGLGRWLDRRKDAP